MERKEEPDGTTRAGAVSGTARGTSPGTWHSAGARKKPCSCPLACPRAGGRCSCCHPRCRQGDRWVPRMAGTGWVQGDPRSKRRGLAPFLAWLGDTSGSASPPPHAAPDLRTPSGRGPTARFSPLRQ